jgi:hypothetical protein
MGLASLIFNWQKWRLNAPQTHLWLIKVRFYASTFVVKTATFAKPENVSGNYLIDSLSASGNINKKGRHLSQYRA